MYEDRVVAFIDILGFSNLVNKKESSTDIIIQIVENLQRISLEAGMDDEPEYGFTYDRQVSLFSDNIVISYRNEGPAEYYLTRELMVLQIAMMIVGIHIRGGLTIGKLYHKGSLVIGPALIRAYDLESKVAIYPRIVFDNTTQSDWCMLAEDYDGIYFIDFLGNPSEWSYYIEKTEGITHKEVLSQIYEACCDIPEISDLRVKAKHEWLKKYILESIIIKDDIKPIRINHKMYKRAGFKV